MDGSGGDIGPRRRLLREPPAPTPLSAAAEHAGQLSASSAVRSFYLGGGSGGGASAGPSPSAPTARASMTDFGASPRAQFSPKPAALPGGATAPALVSGAGDSGFAPPSDSAAASPSARLARLHSQMATATAAFTQLQADTAARVHALRRAVSSHDVAAAPSAAGPADLPAAMARPSLGQAALASVYHSDSGSTSSEAAGDDDGDGQPRSRDGRPTLPPQRADLLRALVGEVLANTRADHDDGDGDTAPPRPASLAEHAAWASAPAPAEASSAAATAAGAAVTSGSSNAQLAADAAVLRVTLEAERVSHAQEVVALRAQLDRAGSMAEGRVIELRRTLSDAALSEQAALTQEVGRLRREAASLTQQLVAATTAAERAESRVASLTSDAAVLRESLAATTAARDEALAVAHRARTHDVPAAEAAAAAAVAAARSDAMAVVAAASREKAELQATLSSMRQAEVAARDTIGTLEERLSALEARWRVTTSEWEGRVEAAVNERVDLAHRLQDCEAQKVRLEAALRESLMAVAGIDSDGQEPAAAVCPHCVGLQTQLNAAEATLADVRASLAAVEADRSALIAQIAAVNVVQLAATSSSSGAVGDGATSPSSPPTSPVASPRREVAASPAMPPRPQPSEAPRSAIKSFSRGTLLPPMPGRHGGRGEGDGSADGAEPPAHSPAATAAAVHGLRHHVAALRGLAIAMRWWATSEIAVLGEQLTSAVRANAAVAAQVRVRAGTTSAAEAAAAAARHGEAAASEQLHRCLAALQGGCEWLSTLVPVLDALAGSTHTSASVVVGATVAEAGAPSLPRSPVRTPSRSPSPVTSPSGSSVHSAGTATIARLGTPHVPWPLGSDGGGDDGGMAAAAPASWHDVGAGDAALSAVATRWSHLLSRIQGAANGAAARHEQLMDALAASEDALARTLAQLHGAETALARMAATASALSSQRAQWDGERRRLQQAMAQRSSEAVRLEARCNALSARLSAPGLPAVAGLPRADSDAPSPGAAGAVSRPPRSGGRDSAIPSRSGVAAASPHVPPHMTATPSPVTAAVAAAAAAGKRVMHPAEDEAEAAAVTIPAVTAAMLPSALAAASPGSGGAGPSVRLSGVRAVELHSSPLRPPPLAAATATPPTAVPAAAVATSSAAAATPPLRAPASITAAADGVMLPLASRLARIRLAVPSQAAADDLRLLAAIYAERDAPSMSATSPTSHTIAIRAVGAVVMPAAAASVRSNEAGAGSSQASRGMPARHSQDASAAPATAALRTPSPPRRRVGRQSEGSLSAGDGARSAAAPSGDAAAPPVARPPPPRVPSRMVVASAPGEAGSADNGAAAEAAAALRPRPPSRPSMRQLIAQPEPPVVTAPVAARQPSSSVGRGPPPIVAVATDGGSHERSSGDDRASIASRASSIVTRGSVYAVGEDGALVGGGGRRLSTGLQPETSGDDARGRKRRAQREPVRVPPHLRHGGSEAEGGSGHVAPPSGAPAPAAAPAPTQAPAPAGTATVAPAPGIKRTMSIAKTGGLSQQVLEKAAEQRVRRQRHLGLKAQYEAAYAAHPQLAAHLSALGSGVGDDAPAAAPALSAAAGGVADAGGSGGGQESKGEADGDEDSVDVMEAYALPYVPPPVEDGEAELARLLMYGSASGPHPNAAAAWGGDGYAMSPHASLRTASATSSASSSYGIMAPPHAITAMGVPAAGSHYASMPSMLPRTHMVSVPSLRTVSAGTPGYGSRAHSAGTSARSSRNGTARSVLASSMGLSRWYARDDAAPALPAARVAAPPPQRTIAPHLARRYAAAHNATMMPESQASSYHYGMDHGDGSGGMGDAAAWEGAPAGDWGAGGGLDAWTGWETDRGGAASHDVTASDVEDAAAAASAAGGVVSAEEHFGQHEAGGGGEDLAVAAPPAVLLPHVDARPKRTARSLTRASASTRELIMQRMAEGVY